MSKERDQVIIDTELFMKKVKDAFFGFVLGDALGVPVEFMTREELAENPVTEMRSGGTHGQPAGTWSDDTSMPLATIHSLIDNGIDFNDQMERFGDWLRNASYTAHDEVFDVGNATSSAIYRFEKGIPAEECGEEAEYSCGNGSLMRMLPLVFYLYGRYGKWHLDDEAAGLIHASSCCTHAHKRCQMACGIYADVIFSMMSGGDLSSDIIGGISGALGYYRKRKDFEDVYPEFEDLETISSWDESMVSGSGYVIHTLQAALWCLATTGGYAECVLKAVNLGEDTDTTAAVAGSLAGLWYGWRTMPLDWLETLAKKEELEKLCKRFGYACLEEA